MLSVSRLHHLFTSLFLLMVFAHQLPAAECRQAHTKLLNDLLTEYDRRVKPEPAAGNETLTVEFDSAIMQIIDVDERNQILNTILWNNVVWTDERLAWSPHNYDGISDIHLEVDSIWLPDIELYNTVDIALSNKGTYTTLVQSYHTGDVRWSYLVNYRSSCSMNLEYFPFDTQDCLLTYNSFQYFAEELNLTIAEDGFDTQFYVENSEFELKSVTASRTVDYVKPNTTAILLNYHIKFRRRSMSYVMNMILPCFLISIVAMLSFYIPADSGEKTGLSITVLLSMSVFLLILSDQMPPTSNYPLIGYYYFGVILVTSLSTCMSVFILTLHHRGLVCDHRAPDWILRLCFNVFAKCLCMKLSTHVQRFTSAEITDDIQLNTAVSVSEYKAADNPSLNNADNQSLDKIPHNQTTNSSEHATHTDASRQDIQHTLYRILSIFCRHERQLLHDQNKAAVSHEWKLIAHVIDRVLFVVFLLMTIVFTLTIMFSASLFSC